MVRSGLWKRCGERGVAMDPCKDHVDLARNARSHDHGQQSPDLSVSVSVHTVALARSA